MGAIGKEFLVEQNGQKGWFRVYAESLADSQCYIYANLYKYNGGANDKIRVDWEISLYQFGTVGANKGSFTGYTTASSPSSRTFKYLSSDCDADILVTVHSPALDTKTISGVNIL